MKSSIYIILASLTFIACNLPQKLLEKGKTERALKVSLRKLKSGKVKTEHLLVFEKAFRNLSHQDAQIVKEMKAAGESSIWPHIYKKAQDMADRQAKVRLVATSLIDRGVEPVIEYYPVEALLEEAADNSALYHYANAVQYFERARKGKRPAARKAYAELENVRYYRSNFKDVVDRQNEMYALGTTHILMVPTTGFDPIPDELYDVLLGKIEYPYRKNWQVYHLDQPQDEEIDFRWEFFLDNLYVSGDNTSSSSCSSSKEVEDGYIEKQVWSEQDSAYITVREIQYKTVSVTVTTYTQDKRGSLYLTSALYDLQNQSKVDEQRILGSDCWSNIYSSVCGDDRALDAGCSDSGGWCASFPSDRNMLIGATLNARCWFYRYLHKKVPLYDS